LITKIYINLKDDEVEFIEEAEDLDEAELNAEMEGLIVLANEFTIVKWNATKRVGFFFKILLIILSGCKR
jgi:hypothetical protein